MIGCCQNQDTCILYLSLKLSFLSLNIKKQKQKKTSPGLIQCYFPSLLVCFMLVIVSLSIAHVFTVFLGWVIKQQLNFTLPNHITPVLKALPC